MDVKNIVVAPYSVGLLFSTVFSLFPRATSQAGMLACTFGDCREVFDSCEQRAKWLLAAVFLACRNFPDIKRKAF